MGKSFISSVLVHDQKQFKHSVELGIVSTPNTNAYIEPTEYIFHFTEKSWMIKQMKLIMQNNFFVISML